MIYVNARAIIECEGARGPEVLVQKRTKPGQEYYEFPGGQVETYESFFAALKREIKEETGLDLLKAEGQDQAAISDQDSVFQVECFRPYLVYQTLQGPVDSMGVYFKCRAQGELLASGDDAKDARWVDLEELKEMLEQDGVFSGVDKGAARFYINRARGE